MVFCALERRLDEDRVAHEGDSERDAEDGRGELENFHGSTPCTEHEPDGDAAGHYAGHGCERPCEGALLRLVAVDLTRHVGPVLEG